MKELFSVFSSHTNPPFKIDTYRYYTQKKFFVKICRDILNIIFVYAIIPLLLNHGEKIMNKKIAKFSELSYILGMIILPLGAALMAKADLGISMVVAPAYLLSLKFDAISFGTAEFILQTLLLAVMSVIAKKVRFGYLLSFVSAIIYGVILDGWMALLALLPEPAFAWKLLFYISGTLVSSLGVAFFFHTYLPPCAYDYFVRDISAHFNIPISRFKISYDVISCILSVIMSFVFFSGIKGVGWGTVVCALVNGFIIGKISSLLEKHIDFSPRLSIVKYFK